MVAVVPNIAFRRRRGKRGRGFCLGRAGPGVAIAARLYPPGALPVARARVTMRRVLSLFVVGVAALACERAPSPDAASSSPSRSVPQHEAGEVEGPDGPGEAMRWRMLRWRNADGTIPEDGLRRALEHRERSLRHAEMVDDGGIAPFGWVERGPWNVGGRTRSLLVDPVYPNRMWAGAVGGGIWTSQDRGQTWTPYDDRMSRLSIGCLAVDPNDPNVLFAGTGEGTYNADAIPGDGIYKSTDRGVTWARIPGTESFLYTMSIAVSPVDPNLILAATRGGIRRSTDGGRNWTVVEAASNSLQVLFDPNDPTKMLGHAMERGSSNWHRVVYSTDSGATWTVAQSGLNRKDGISSRIEVAYAASRPGWVYANCGDNDGEIWKSTDGGVNWTLVSSGYGNPFGWYCNTIWVDPTDETLLVIGSNYTFRSTNGGQTVQRIGAGYIMTTEPHPDVHRFVPDPGYDGVNNRRFYVTTDGAIYGTDDIRTVSPSTGWYRLDQTYRTTQYYGAAGDGPSGLIVGGTQDNGTLALLSTSSNDAVLTFGGDGGFCAVDSANPSYTYGEYVYLQVHRSTNGGRSANYIYRGIGDAGSGSTANFIAPFVLDPNDQQRMLAGGISLWRTGDARASRPSWSAIKPSVGAKISAIAVAPGDADLVVVGHNDGRVYVSRNATAASPAWNAIDDNAGLDPFPDRYVGRILIDPDDHNLIYVALGGFTPDNLWRTTNGGQSWALAVGTGATSLPPAPVNGLARHPRRPGWMYAATEVGVWASTDGGQTWGTNNDGPANTAVDEIVFMHGSEELLAATHGRGLWTIEVADCASYSPDNEPAVGPCNAVPFGLGSLGIRYQALVTRDELRARAGAIVDLGFAPCADGDRTHSRIVVRMSHVPRGYALTSSFAANLPTPVTVLNKTGWTWTSVKDHWSWLGLENAFVYDGQSDVVVDVELIGTQWTGTVPDMRRDVGTRLYAGGWVSSPPPTGTLSTGALKMAFSYGCPTISVHGTECFGLHIGATGSPSLGGSYGVDATGADPGAPVYFNFGLNSSGPVFPIDLAFLGLSGCKLWHDSVVSFAVPAGPTGDASFQVAVPGIAAAQGFRLYAMAISPKLSSPGGLAMSEYLRIVHGL